MTEPQGGSDPSLFRRTPCASSADRIINGEKWFTSAGRGRHPVRHVHQRHVRGAAQDAGVEIMPEPRNHNHIVYRDVRVPDDHLLGPEDGAKVLAQRRLSGGHIHHAMRTIARSATWPWT